MKPDQVRNPFSLLRRVWFPLGLVLLLVAAVPGIVLFLLSLTGAAEPVNDWLIENVNLTYHFALPGWLGILLLLVPLAIILLYFLRLKRKPLQVPSTFLWRKSIEDLRVNSLFQWLRENVLLLLQLLAVLALIYTVMGFRFHGNTTRGKHYILLIDNSASMAATDAAPSRLHWAKEQALREIDAASDDDVGMVIVFNSKATTLQAYTSDRARLREAVKSIEQTQRPTRIEEALSLADSLANPLRSTEDVASRPEAEEPGKERTYVQPQGIETEVHLFSDGRFPDLSESALANLNSRRLGNTSVLGNLNVQFHSAGVPGREKVDNVGIVALNALRMAGDGKPAAESDWLRLQVLVRVRNYRPELARVQLRLDVLVDGKLTHPEQRDIDLPARTVQKNDDDKTEPTAAVPGEATLKFVLPPLDPRADNVVHAYLHNVKDQFPLDDRAWLVVGKVRKARILLVGPDNPVLDAFFKQDATRKIATVDRLTAADLTTDAYRDKARAGDYDLIIFDRCAPEDEKDLPQSNTFFIDRPPPPWQRGSQTLTNPYLMVAKQDNPLLRHLTTLWDVGVSEAFRFHLRDNLRDAAKAAFQLQPGDKGKRALPPLTRLIEASGDTALLFTLPRGSYTDLVMTFPLVDDRGELNTNWPLQPSFPLFLRNVVYVLGNVGDAVREATVQPGEPVVLRPEAGVRWLKITPPQGPTETLQRGPRPEFTYANTELQGVYRVARDDGQERRFAVNLLDAAESDIEPRTEVQIGTERLIAGRERRQPHEMWKWAVLLALLLLLIEWYIYNRRIYV
jgi:Aerotolerance regulator N-terminal/von Willebrand factor type A domain